MSRVPPFMKPQKVKQILSTYAEIGRIYLAPEGDRLAARRSSQSTALPPFTGTKTRLRSQCFLSHRCGSYVSGPYSMMQTRAPVQGARRWAGTVGKGSLRGELTQGHTTADGACVVITRACFREAMRALRAGGWSFSTRRKPSQWRRCSTGSRSVRSGAAAHTSPCSGGLAYVHCRLMLVFGTECARDVMIAFVRGWKVCCFCGAAALAACLFSQLFSEKIGALQAGRSALRSTTICGTSSICRSSSGTI